MFFSAPHSSTPTTSASVYERNIEVPVRVWNRLAVSGSLEAITVAAG